MFPTDILTMIAQSLDYKSVAKLRLTSKEAHAHLTPLFLKISHPHAVAYIADQILQLHKKKAQTSQFILIDTYDETLRYKGRMTTGMFGPLVLFSVTADTNSTVTISSRSGTAFITKDNHAFGQIMGTITIILTPSLERPIHEGSIRIMIDNDIIVKPYTTDPETILSWCPMEVLPTKYSLHAIH